MLLSRLHTLYALYTLYTHALHLHHTLADSALCLGEDGQDEARSEDSLHGVSGGLSGSPGADMQFVTDSGILSV